MDDLSNLEDRKATVKKNEVGASSLGMLLIGMIAGAVPYKNTIDPAP